MNRPWITISYAQSLDGRIATAEGDSHWISGRESLVFAHELRRDHQAILVGIGTLLQDDPELTCRLVPGPDPVRVVLDRQLRTPDRAKILKTKNRAPVWIFCSQRVEESEKKRLENRGARVFSVLDGSPQELDRAMECLAQEEVSSVYVEGGGRVITSFLRQGLYDRVAVVCAPVLIGQGVDAVGDLGVRRLSQARKPLFSRTRSLGVDTLVDLYFRDPESLARGGAS